MSNRFLTLMPIWSGLILANAITGSAQLPTVPTASEPVTNYYHQVAVVDDYQWLEDAANPAVRDWIHRQNERPAPGLTNSISTLAWPGNWASCWPMNRPATV